MGRRACELCRSEMSSSRSSKCAKCEANEAKYGKPSICLHCQLPAAFRGGRCVHCTHAERKFGPPQACGTCKAKSAFRDPAAPKRPTLICRLCRLTLKRSQAKAAAAASASPKGAAKATTVTANLAATATTAAAPSMLSHEVAILNRDLAAAKKEALAKDKKIADLNARLLQEEREHRQKLQETQRQSEVQLGQLQDEVRELRRQLARAKAPTKSPAQAEPLPAASSALLRPSHPMPIPPTLTI